MFWKEVPKVFKSIVCYNVECPTFHFHMSVVSHLRESCWNRSMQRIANQIWANKIRVNNMIDPKVTTAENLTEMTSVDPLALLVGTIGGRLICDTRKYQPVMKFVLLNIHAKKLFEFINSKTYQPTIKECTIMMKKLNCIGKKFTNPI